MLFPQSNIMSAFVHRHSNQLSDFSLGLPKYSNHIVTQFTTVYSIFIVNLVRLLSKMSICQHSRVTLNILIPHGKVVVIIFNTVQITNDEFWQKET